jgi:hypothetical protein
MRLSHISTLTLFGIAFAGIAFATSPDTGNCTFDSRLGRSPKNVEVANPTFQYTYRGVLRDNAGQPVPNYPAFDIRLEINAPCQNPAQIQPDGPSDANGNVIWGAVKLDHGGACTGTDVVRVRLISIGIFKVLNEITSPDEDGDGFVALSDLGTFQAAFVGGGPQYQGDLDLSGGAPNLSDLSFFQRHFLAP